MRFRSGDQVMLPNGSVGTVVSGVDGQLTEGDGEEMVVVAVTEGGVEWHRLVPEHELLSRLQESRA